MRRLTHWLALVVLTTSPLAAQTVSQDSVRAKLAADSIIRISSSSRVDRLAAELKGIVNRLVKALRPVPPPPPPPAPPPAPPPPPPPPPVSVPANPEAPGFVATLGSTTASVLVSWAAVSGATSYVYSSSTVSGETSGTSFTMPGIARGASIFACIWAKNSAGQSADNACNGFTVPAASPPPASVQAFWLEPKPLTLASVNDSVEVCAFLRFTDGVVATSTNARAGGCATRLTGYQAGRLPSVAQQSLADTACTGFTAALVSQPGPLGRVRVMGARSCRAYVYAQ